MLEKLRSAFPYLTGLFLALLILFSVWPGFMSYDSVFMLNQARNGITDNTHSVVMILIWRVLDKIYPGPALLVFFHSALFLVALAHILRLFLSRVWLVVLLLLGVASFSPLLGPLLAAWKDNGMLAFLMAGSAALAHAEIRASRRALWVAAVFLAVATTYRHDALAASAPLILWWSWLVSKHYTPAKPRRFVRVAAIFVAMMALTWGSKVSIDRAAGPPSTAWTGIALFDLIGTSHYAGVNLLPSETYSHHETFGQEDLDHIYFVDHVNLSLEPSPHNEGLKLLRPAPREALKAAWLDAVTHYPAGYLRHRINFAANSVAFTRTTVYYPAHYGVDANDLGVTFQPTRRTDLLMAWVRSSSASLRGKPWVYYFVGLALAVAFLARFKLQEPVPLFLYASGYCHLLAAVFVMPAADLRYQLWSLAAVMTASILAIALLFSSKLMKARARKGCDHQTRIGPMSASDS